MTDPPPQPSATADRPPKPWPPVRHWKLFLICAVAVPLLFSLDFDPAVWAVLGIVLGLGAGAIWAPSTTVEPRAASRSGPPDPAFVALARAALPLSMPLLIVLIAGTDPSPAAVQVVAGAVGAFVAWTYMVRPEVDAFRGIPAKFFMAALVLLIVVVTVVEPKEGGEIRFADEYDDRGGLSTSLLEIAAVLWIIAGALRLMAFASTGLRIAAGVLLAATAGRLLSAGGVIGGHEWLADHAPVLDAEVLALVALGLLCLDVTIEHFAPHMSWVRSVAERLTRRGGVPPDAVRGVAGLGLGFAVIAALTLGFAVVAGLEETDRRTRTHGPATPGGPEVTAQPPRARPGEQFPPGATTFPDELVRTYMPVLAFRADQPWLPVAVDDYARRAELLALDGTPIAGSGEPKDLTASCAQLAGSPCKRLTISCKAASDDCSGGTKHAENRKPGQLEPPLRSGAVYVRALRRPESAKSGSGRAGKSRFLVPTAFPNGVARFGRDEVSILIQYWYFYEYDEWTTPVLTGDLVQRHEGDWEAVMVGLSDDRPLFVAYSSHCGGEWSHWERTRVARTPVGGRRTRPLVAVARGSQANYARGDENHSPDWAACAGIASDRATLISYASNIRDRTAYGFTWEPPDTDGGVREAREDKAPMSFPGFWGGKGATVLLNEREHSLAKGGEPRTPSMQGLWRQPLTTVFCRSTWDYPDGVTSKCPPGERR